MGDYGAMNKCHSSVLCSMLLQDRHPCQKIPTFFFDVIEKITFLHPSAKDSIVVTVNSRSQLLL